MSQALSWGRHYLLVEPRHFDVTYRINPWMAPGVDGEAALAQWKGLVAEIERLGARVEVGHDVEGLPDMAFAMNAGFAFDGRVVASRFRHPERRPEEQHWLDILTAVGLEPVELDVAEGVRFEAGDAFVVGDVLVGGWGFRSDREAVEALAALLGRRLVPLELRDPRFYHLDTCFCPLRDGHALAYLDAMAAPDRAALVDAIPDLFALTEAEAVTFVANSLVIDDTFVTAACPTRVASHLRALGLEVVTVEMGEFHRSGGSVRCLTLPLDIQMGIDRRSAS